MACREVPLLHPQTHLSWHEQMVPGEFAVHPSQQLAAAPTCTICDSLPEAEHLAQQQVLARRTLRCRIYDHHGFVGAPLAEITGTQFKGELDLSARVRRWLGVSMLAVGILLCAIDWHSDFRLSWPGLIGSRLLIPAVVLLVTEALILLNTWQKTLQQRKTSAEPASLAEQKGRPAR